jgi:hypothetical protein
MKTLTTPWHIKVSGQFYLAQFLIARRGMCWLGPFLAFHWTQLSALTVFGSGANSVTGADR